MTNCENCGKELEALEQREICKACQGRFNSILAYCQCHLHNYAANEVADAIEIHFSSHELIEARQLLKDHWIQHLDGLTIVARDSRRDTNARSAQKAYSADITMAVDKLMKIEKPPRFIAWDLRSLPIVKPMSSDRDQDERLIILENTLRRLERRVNMNENNIETLMTEKDAAVNQKLSAIDNTLRTHQNLIERAKPSYAAKVSTGAQGGSAKPLDFPLAASAIPRSSSSLQPRSVESPVNSPRRQVGQHPNDSDKEWQVKRYKRRPRGIQGKAQGSDIRARAGGPNRDLWISNVDSSMEDDTLKDFIENGGSTKTSKIQVRLWEKRYTDGSGSKRFRLTIGKSDYDKVYNADFWPSDIEVRKYWLSAEERQALKPSVPSGDAPVPLT